MMVNRVVLICALCKALILKPDLSVRNRELFTLLQRMHYQNFLQENACLRLNSHQHP